jgi:hypothetical protein
MAKDRDIGANGEIRLGDPSALTTQQLWREIQNLREFMESRIDGLEELVDSRITGIEKSIEVAHNDLVRVPTDVQKQVGNLRDLHNEKFHGIEARFQERDVRFAQKDRDMKTAIEAAFQSASAAVAKSEAVTAKQIDQQGNLIQTETRALSGRIDDVKERLTKVESLGIGEKGGKTDQQRMISWVLALIMTLIAIGTVIFTRPR